MPARGAVNTPDRQALKARAGALVKAVGGVEAAEGFCRANFRRLSEYGRPENDVFMPIDVVEDLEAIAHGTPGHPQVTRYLARRAGYALVKLPSPLGVGTDSVHLQLADAASESNDVITGVLKALADGSITPAEARTLAPECVEAAEAFMRFHALLEQIAVEP